MAVHLPLSAEAQAEARVLMLSANNILSPASGRPMVDPTQDMVYGGYYMTLEDEGAKGEGREFRHVWEVERAYENGDVDLHALIEFRCPDLLQEDGTYQPTTAGRVLFNEALPADFPFFNELIGKNSKLKNSDPTSPKVPASPNMMAIVEVLAKNYPKAVVAEALDKIKNLGFKFSTRSGLTISIDDVGRRPIRTRSSSGTRRKRTRPSSSSSGASSPTTSGATRRSRSGSPLARKSAGRWMSRSRRPNSTRSS